mgnify:CR=1 FL=1
MSVFLLILKIIGIVLLSIIGFALFLVLLVLFVPVRYKGKGYYRNNEYDFKANASWLLHIVSFSYGLKEEEGLCFRLFVICYFYRLLFCATNRPQLRSSSQGKKASSTSNGSYFM